jgi:hypothetical protein
MFFKYIFLIDNYEPGMLSALCDEATSEFIIRLSGKSLARRKEIFDDLSVAKQRFSFLVSTELVKDYVENPESSLTRSLVLLFFLPNYTREKQQHVIYLNETPAIDDLLAPFTFKLKSELVGQGIDINVEVLSTATGKNDPGNATAIINKELNAYLEKDNVGVFFDEYFKKLIRIPLLSRKWVVSVNSPETFLHYYSMIKRLESAFISAEPILSYYLGNYNQLQSSLSTIEHENLLLKIKQKNSMHYLKMLRQASLQQIHQIELLNSQRTEAVHEKTDGKLLKEIEDLKKNRDAIQEWYSKEYEILPKWYKRTGHVIKAFMGKRTFRSLFK